MSLTDLEGNTYGPHLWHVTPQAVADFVEITGDEPDRWDDTAPPGFAAAALFAVAPDLLAELYRHSVVHGEQTFTWHRPLPIDEVLEVSGTVTRVRDRGEASFVTFEMSAGDALAGKSLFLASRQPGTGEHAEEKLEPPHDDRGEVGDGQVSASRADLVRYAAATRDWNPVHWDHEAAVAAGFPGVVVHGLLQAGWTLRSYTTSIGRDVASAKFRFRNPLFPAWPVSVGIDGNQVVLADGDTQYLTAILGPTDE